MFITYNLRDALIAIRNQKGIQDVWADALCINQTDILERNHEVKRMANIYRQASRVIVWLGKTPSDWSFLGKRPSRDLNSIIPRTFLHTTAEGSEAIENCSNDEILTLCALIERPYWRRVWIHQELNAAGFGRTAFFWAGELWPLLTLFALIRTRLLFEKQWDRRLLDTVKEVLKDEEDADSNLIASHIMSSNAKHHNLELQVKHIFASNFFKFTLALPTHELLCDTSAGLSVMVRLAIFSECSDDRDLVYGLLGMYDEKIFTRIIPNYRLSVEEVYLEFAMAIIATEGFERMLIAVTNAEADSTTAVPSWVLDFRSADQVGDSTTKERFRAGGGINSSLHFTHSGHRIHCQGLSLGNVNCAGGEVRYESWHAIQEALARVLSLSEDQVSSEKSYASIPWEATGRFPEWDAALKAVGISYIAEYFWNRHANFKIGNVPIKNWFWDLQEVELSEWYLTDLETSIHETSEWNLLIAKDGSLGFGHPNIQSQDILVIIKGFKMPIALRWFHIDGGESGYKYIGPCYVDGYMFGEALQDKSEDIWESISII